MAEEDGREHRLPRSKICSICGEESESFHLNYGASSCFSCRAFFRRAIQKTREPKFECKKLLPQLGGLCNIQGRKSRKKCQKCRYELCLRAGMRPDQVLEDEAKKTRFRKLITKQLIEETDLPPTTTAPPAARSQSAPTTSFPRRRKVTLEDLPRDLIDRTKLTFKRKRAGSPPSATTPTPLPSAPCRPLGSLVDDVKILFDDSGGKGRYYGGGDPCLATGAMELINPNATLKSRGGQDSCADPSKKSPSPSINPGEIRVVPIEGLTSHKNAPVAPNQSFRLNPGTIVPIDPTAKYSSLDQVDPTLSGSLSLIGPFPHTSSTSGSQIGLHPDQVPGSIDPKLALELTKSPIIPHGFEIQPGPSKPQNSDRPFCSPLPHNLLGNSCTSFPDLGISDLQQLPQDLMTLGKDLALKGLEDPHQSQPGESSKIPQSGPNQGSILVANLLGKDEEVLGASSSSNRCPDLTQEEEAQLSSLNRHYEMEAPSDALFTRFLTSHEGSHREWLLANGDSFKQSAFWRLGHIQRAWVIACKRMEIDPEFAEALLDHHTGRRENLLTKHLVKRHVLALTKVYRDFAYQQPEFTLLTTSDQRKLLLHNSRTFVQYVFGRYFSAPTGSEQIHWLFLSHIPVHFPEKDIRASYAVSFSELNSSLNLFNDPIVASNYLGLCEMFRCANLPHWCDSFIALVSLFQNDFSGFFEDQAAIEAQLKYKVLNMLTSDGSGGITNEMMETMLGKLEAMSDLFNTNVRWDSSHPICYLGDPASLDLARSEIVVSYTEAEERWMYKMNDRFEDCFSQVNCGESLLRDYLMFSLGIPLPPSYVANMARVFAERMRRILLSCEEFQYLPGNCQEAMLKDNVIEATTLCLARMDTLTDSKTQLNFALGKHDRLNINACFGVIKKSIVLKRISSSCSDSDNNSSSSLLAALPETVRARFVSLSSSVGSFVRDKESFQILIYVLLLSAAGSSSSVVSALQSKFFTLFHQRARRQFQGDQTRADLAIMDNFRRRIVVENKELSQLVAEHILHQSAGDQI